MQSPLFSGLREDCGIRDLKAGGEIAISEVIAISEIAIWR